MTTDGRASAAPEIEAGSTTQELRTATDWLKITKTQLKVKQGRQTRAYVGFSRPKIGTMRFGQ